MEITLLAMKYVKFVLLCTISASIVYPILFLVGIPVLIYYWLVQKFLLIFDPKCGEIFSGLSALVAGTDPFKKPFAVLCPYYLFSDKVDRKRVIQVLDEKIIKPNIYPELKQRLIRKFGYHVWQNYDSFSLENHVRYLYPDFPNKPVLKSELRGLVCEEVILAGFDKRFSPWKIVIVPNLFDPENPHVKSALLFHVNHGLMDGLSIAKFLQKTGKPWDWPLAHTFSGKAKENSGRHYLDKIFKLAELLLTGPYYAIKFALSEDDNEFLTKALSTADLNNLENPVRKIGDFRYINFDQVKSIRSRLNVGTSSILTTVIAEGVAKYMKRKCQNGFSKLPKSFIVLMVIPLPGHPDKLANRWSMIRLPFKINETGDPIATAQRLQNKYQKLSNSAIPLINYYLFSLLGLLPIFCRPPPSQSLRQTVLLTNFPGPKQSIGEAFGYNTVDWNLLGSGLPRSAILVASQSVSDKIWFEFGGSKEVFSNQDEILLLEDCFFSVLAHLETNKNVL